MPIVQHKAGHEELTGIPSILHASKANLRDGTNPRVIEREREREIQPAWLMRTGLPEVHRPVYMVNV